MWCVTKWRHMVACLAVNVSSSAVLIPCKIWKCPFLQWIQYLDMPDSAVSGMLWSKWQTLIAGLHWYSKSMFSHSLTKLPWQLGMTSLDAGHYGYNTRVKYHTFENKSRFNLLFSSLVCQPSSKTVSELNLPTGTEDLKWGGQRKR